MKSKIFLVAASTLVIGCGALLSSQPERAVSLERQMSCPIESEITLDDYQPIQVTRRYVARASWYQMGRVTANGERYDPEGLTVAHRRYPFGTRLRLTNPSNGKSVVVRVNDRGPFIRGRELDVSRGVAKRLDFIERGVVSLVVEAIRS